MIVGASSWLVLHVYKSLDFLSDVKFNGSNCNVHVKRVITARWKLILAYYYFMTAGENSVIINTTEFSSFKKRVIECLYPLLQDYLFLRLLRRVLSDIFSPLWDRRFCPESHTELLVTCSLIETILSFLRFLIRGKDDSDILVWYRNRDPEIQRILETSFSIILDVFFQEENKILSQYYAITPEESDSFTIRSEGLVRAHFAVTKYLTTVVLFINMNKFCWKPL